MEINNLMRALSTCATCGHQCSGRILCEDCGRRLCAECINESVREHRGVRCADCRPTREGA